MKKRYYFLATFLLIFLVIFFFYNKKPSVNVNTVSTEIIIDAKQITEYFVRNEEKANILYRNKVIEIKGNIKTINFKNNKNTILLHGTDKNHNVICDMNIDLEKNQNLATLNKEVIVKGICKGFLNDVIVLHCILINKETNE